MMKPDLRLGDEMGRKDDPMDEVWASPTWRPLDQQWSDDDNEGVNVIPAEEAVLREPTERAPFDHEVNVPMLRHALNADDLHAQRISALTIALQAAIDFLTLPKTGAKAWAADLRYAESVIGHIEDAADSCVSALRLIDISEQK